MGSSAERMMGAVVAMEKRRDFGLTTMLGFRGTSDGDDVQRRCERRRSGDFSFRRLLVFGGGAQAENQAGLGAGPAQPEKARRWPCED